jgi:hypothetical protein
VLWAVQRVRGEEKFSYENISGARDRHV